MNEQNFGVFEEYIPTDYVSGVSSPIPFQDRNVDWTTYLSKKEYQSHPETYSCVSFSSNHCIDAQVNYLMATGQLQDETIAYFRDAGYLDDTLRFNSSDRFTAIMSGTTKNGNSCNRVIESTRKVGLLPEKDLPKEGRTFEEYHDKRVITPEMKAKALKILDYLDIKYEWVSLSEFNVLKTLKGHLAHCPLQITIPICPRYNVDNPIKTCGLRKSQHAIMLYRTSNVFETQDQYDPVLKNLSFDYPILSVLKIVVNMKAIPPKKPTPPITKKETFSYIKKLLDFYTRFKDWVFQPTYRQS